VRDAVLTDGPMIRVLAPDGASAIGRTLSLAPGGITLTVHIESADWVPVTMLELIHSDGRIEPIPVQWHPRDHAIVGDVRLQATARDAFVLFRVRGTEPNPVLTGDPPLLPMALTNPVYLR
jgi:hypothetical protein